MNNTKELYKSFSIYLNESKLNRFKDVILKKKIKVAFNYLRHQKELNNYSNEYLVSTQGRGVIYG